MLRDLKRFCDILNPDLISYRLLLQNGVLCNIELIWMTLSPWNVSLYALKKNNDINFGAN